MCEYTLFAAFVGIFVIIFVGVGVGIGICVLAHGTVCALTHGPVIAQPCAISCVRQRCPVAVRGAGGGLPLGCRMHPTAAGECFGHVAILPDDHIHIHIVVGSSSSQQQGVIWNVSSCCWWWCNNWLM